MRRPVVVLTLLAVLLAPGLAVPRSVQACSLDPDFDPIAEMDIVFAGMVVGLRVAEDLWDGVNAFVPVWVDFQVDHYLKGNGPRVFAALDPVSVVFESPEDAHAGDFDRAGFLGAGGACGALWDDPRGDYWVTAVEPHNGHHRVSQPLLIARGTGPDDPALLAALADAGIAPAATGHGVGAPTDQGVPLALSALGLVLLASARALTSRRDGRGRAR